MKKIYLLFFCLLSLVGFSSASHAEESDSPETMVYLPEPQKNIGAPLMKALSERKTTREFSVRKINDQDLSNLLWAAVGINRPNGKLTIPTARDARDLSVYVIKQGGAYRYNSEKNALESLRAFNGGTYEKIDEVASELKDNNEKFSLKIGELEEQVSTLTTERDTNMQNYENAQSTISTLTEDLEKLKEYKANVELQEKEQVIESYADILGEEILSEYKNKISEYKDALTLDKELAYELKRSNPSVFTRTPQYVPKDEPKSGIEEILAKYKK